MIRAHKLRLRLFVEANHWSTLIPTSAFHPAQRAPSFLGALVSADGSGGCPIFPPLIGLQPVLWLGPIIRAEKIGVSWRLNNRSPAHSRSAHPSSGLKTVSFKSLGTEKQVLF